MSASRKNPWQAEGVSLLPENPADLMPLVGQKRLFDKLVGFRDEILARGTGQELAGFYMVIGGWGLGKSRVGHEICLEAVSDDVEWIVDGAPTRLLEAGLQQGILPIFLRYVDLAKAHALFPQQRLGSHAVSAGGRRVHDNFGRAAHAGPGSASDLGPAGDDRQILPHPGRQSAFERPGVLKAGLAQ